MIAVKVCLNSFTYWGPYKLDHKFEEVLRDEVNVLKVRYGGFEDNWRCEYDVSQNEEAIKKTEERYKAREEAIERKKLDKRHQV